MEGWRSLEWKDREEFLRFLNNGIRARWGERPGKVSVGRIRLPGQSSKPRHRGSPRPGVLSLGATKAGYAGSGGAAAYGAGRASYLQPVLPSACYHR